MNLQSKDYKDILGKILEAIEFADDKEVFINQFSANIYLQSIADLIQPLHPGDQEKIKLEIASIGDNTGKLEDIVNTHFTEEQRFKAIESASRQTLIDYISTIKDTLSPLQKQNLAKLFQEITAVDKNSSPSMV